MQDKYSWLKDWVGACVNSVIIRELTAEQAVEAIEAKIIQALEQSELEAVLEELNSLVFGHLGISHIHERIATLQLELKNIKAKQ